MTTSSISGAGVDVEQLSVKSNAMGCSFIVPQRRLSVNY